MIEVNLAQILADIQREQKDVLASHARLMRKIAIFVWKEARRLTPVRTGRARDSIVISAGRRDRRTKKQGYSQALAVAVGLKPFQDLWIQGNGRVIHILEFGAAPSAKGNKSGVRPRRMVTRAVEAAQGLVES